MQHWSCFPLTFTVDRKLFVGLSDTDDRSHLASRHLYVLHIYIAI